MKVLSLFDGISCGRVALERAGIKVDKYYASEIDKYAQGISLYHWPDIVRLGDIKNWENWDLDLSEIDLIFAGFPCQAWSVAGERKGVEDPRGELAITLTELFNKAKELNPNIDFLFENVRMSNEHLKFINNLFKAEPILINSALVSAQSRNRYYWLSTSATQPDDKEIFTRDILEYGGGKEASLSDFLEKAKNPIIPNSGKDFYLENKRMYLTPSQVEKLQLSESKNTGQCKIFAHKKRYRRGFQVFFDHGKVECLDTAKGGGRGAYAIDKIGLRRMTPIECERLQTLDVIVHLLKCMFPERRKR